VNRGTISALHRGVTSRPGRLTPGEGGPSARWMDPSGYKRCV